MMEEKIIIQKLKVSSKSLSLAEKYYSLLSAFNSLGMTEREIQFVAYVAISGKVTQEMKKEFCKMHNTSEATIGNIISKMKRKKIIIKKENDTKVNPVIAPDFNKNIVMEIKLLHEKG